MNKKIILIIISIIFWFGCVSSISTDSPYNSIKTRHIINECETFDCSILDKEIKLLITMIENDDINQSVQQNIVTSITKKCGEVKIKDIPCKKYKLNRKLLYGKRYESN